LYETHGYDGARLQNLKIIFLFLALLSSGPARAEWRAMVERAGFLGKVAAGTSYEFNPEHAVDYLLGMYEIGNDHYYQSNLMYRYSHWNVPVRKDVWRPLQLGAFVVYAMNNDRYFMDSPDVYPESNYYDGTAIRYGTEFSSTYTWYPSRIGLGYHIRIFDNGIIAIFNNSNRDLQYYISSGFSLQYVF
jgi:hypothetical protein